MMKNIILKLEKELFILGIILVVVGVCGFINSSYKNEVYFQNTCFIGILIILAVNIIVSSINKERDLEERQMIEKFTQKQDENFEEYKTRMQSYREQAIKDEEIKTLIKQQEQIQYKELIEEKFLEARANPEVMNIVSNFFPQIPELIFLSKECYIFFEYLLVKDYDIARKTIWSTSELNGIENRLKPDVLDKVNSFFENDFSKLRRLLQKTINLDNDHEVIFVLLRLLQIEAPSYYSQEFSKNYNINFDNIDEISFEECLFIYYNSQSLIKSNIYEDPVVSLFAYYLISNKKFGEVTNIEYYNFLSRRAEILEKLEELKEEFDFRIFESNMTKKGKKIQKGYSIQDVDLMGGAEFEQFIAKLFKKMGYQAEVTKHSGDFGVDVITEKDGIKIGIQAKCYVGVVPNSAIQEIAAGIKHYKCDRGIVVTNSKFTKAAVELAKSNSIQLWDRKILEEKILDIFQE